jgi:hypothetical protein
MARKINGLELADAAVDAKGQRVATWDGVGWIYHRQFGTCELSQLLCFVVFTSPTDEYLCMSLLSKRSIRTPSFSTSRHGTRRVIPGNLSYQIGRRSRTQTRLAAWSSCLRLAVTHRPVSFLVANSSSTFDSAAHFYRGETAGLTLPTAIPADRLVCLGPNLIFARFKRRGFFSKRFIPSATDTSKHDKTPVLARVRHKKLLASEEHGATVRNFTQGLPPAKRVGQLSDLLWPLALRVSFI